MISAVTLRLDGTDYGPFGGDDGEPTDPSLPGLNIRCGYGGIDFPVASEFRNLTISSADYGDGDIWAPTVTDMTVTPPFDTSSGETDGDAANSLWTLARSGSGGVSKAVATTGSAIPGGPYSEWFIEFDVRFRGCDAFDAVVIDFAHTELPIGVVLTLWQGLVSGVRHQWWSVATNAGGDFIPSGEAEPTPAGGFVAADPEFIVDDEWHTIGVHVTVAETPVEQHGVRVAFDAATFESDPAWTYLDNMEGISVESFTVDRGRQSERAKTDTGRAVVKGKDFTGVFDPTNTDGPFYGKFKQRKQAALALQNPVTEEWTDLFTGFVSEWQWSMDASGNFADWTLELIDGLGIFSTLEMTPDQHGQTPPDESVGDIYFEGEPTTAKHVDDRLMDVLDTAGWPNIGEKRAGLRDIFSGNVTVQEVVYDRFDGLMQAIDDAVDAEFPGLANRYMSKTGVFTFHGRFASIFPERPGYGLGSWKIGGHQEADADPAFALMADFDFRISDQDLINNATGLPQGLDEDDVPGQVSKDDDSIDEFGWCNPDGSMVDLLTFAGHDDDDNPTTAAEETKKFSDYYVGNHKDTHIRVERIRLQSRGDDDAVASLDPALWALLCGAEISDLISPFKTTHFGGAGGFDGEYLIQGLHYEVERMGEVMRDVKLELDVFPKPESNPFGELDSGDE